MMAARDQQDHIPVMRDEVLKALSPQGGEVYVDGTFGAGGYSRALLEAAACTVVAIDRDPHVIPHARSLKAAFGDRFTFMQGAFGNVRDLVREAGYDSVSGFVLDLGVSSMQLDQAGRGFSFRFEGPLDMRMNPDSGGPSAADLVNALPEDELADLIYKYGEERRSRHVAHAIAEERAKEPIATTGQLADIVRRVVRSSKADKIDPATRTFQALRIAVNDELRQLEQALEESVNILAPGGRLVVVTFHSLEDRIVKNFMKEKAGQTPAPSRHMPVKRGEARGAAMFDLPRKGAVKATQAEMDVNPRARSAKMRVAVRTDARAEGGRP